MGLAKSWVLIGSKNSKKFDAREVGPYVRLEGEVWAANKEKESISEGGHRGRKHARQIPVAGLSEHAMESGLWCPCGTLSQVSPTLREDIWMTF